LLCEMNHWRFPDHLEEFHTGCFHACSTGCGSCMRVYQKLKISPSTKRQKN
jgi:hypothetical protein